MNRILLFSFFVFSFIGLEAQNWKLFQGDGLYHFNASNIRSIHVDSVEAVGVDSLYHFNWVFNDSMSFSHYNHGPNFNQVDSFLMPNFFGRTARLSVDSSFLETQEEDEILILHKANIGQQWELLNNGFLIIRATVDSLYLDSVQGNLDSLKRIRLNTFNAAANPVAHSINNKHLILSKNHGFMQAMDFYYLFYFGSTINDSLLKRIDVNLQKTRREIFDYQIGDEYHLQKDEWYTPPTNPYPPDFLNTTILNTNLSANLDAINYSYKVILEENTATVLSNPFRVILNQNIYQSIDSSQKSNLNALFMNGLPDEVRFTSQYLNWNEYNAFRVKSNRYNGRLMYTIQRQAIKDTLGTFVYTTFDDDEYVFIEGVCSYTIQYWWNGGNQNRIWYNLLYFKKGNETWGQPRIVTQLEEQDAKQKLNVYPNPSSDIIRIESEETIRQVSLYNLQGQEMPVTLENDQSIQLPENSGLYLLKVQMQGGETVIQKVIRN